MKLEEYRKKYLYDGNYLFSLIRYNDNSGLNYVYLNEADCDKCIMFPTTIKETNSRRYTIYPGDFVKALTKEGVGFEGIVSKEGLIEIFTKRSGELFVEENELYIPDIYDKNIEEIMIIGNLWEGFDRV